MLIGGTDPVLTHMGNPWYFRFRPNDTYSARVIADYGTKTLGKKKWAVVNTTDAFGTSGMKLLVESLKGMGIEPVLIQGYPNFSQDFTAVALAVKQSGADVMGTYMFEADQAMFAKQLRQMGVNPTWVGSPTTVSVTALKLAGPALYGSYAVTDFNRNLSEAAKASQQNPKPPTKRQPISLRLELLRRELMARAIDERRAGARRAGARRPVGERLRRGPGRLQFQQERRRTHGYNVVKNNNGVVVFDSTSTSTTTCAVIPAHNEIREPGIEWSRSHDDATERNQIRSRDRVH